LENNELKQGVIVSLMSFKLDMNKLQITELNELPKFSKENWLESVNKSLKNKTLEDLYLGKEGLSIDPFPTDTGQQHIPLKRNQKEWIVGVECASTDPHALNGEILHYLENGAEAIRVNQVSKAEWTQILDQVHTDFIYIDINDQIAIGPNVLKKGALQNNELGDQIHSISISSKSNLVIEELTEVFKKVITKIKANQTQVNQIRIETTVNSYMPISISKLRAIRILWLNILKHFGVELNPVFLCVRGNAVEEDQNHALIELSTMAVNAVLGGCDLLYLNGKNFDVNQRRLSLNIQHMLKMESKMHIYEDPLAGSFSIENLTKQICEKVWSNITMK
jgi:hypothetical protein